MAVKKAFQPLIEALEALAPNTTIKSILENPTILKLVTASKGGFNGEDSFISILSEDGTLMRVARKCAMTGAYFAHDNTDKAKSFFYKNGSYMIGGEVTKANARKQWDMDREDAEAELEDQMLEGEINPKEWKEKVTALKANTFEWELTEDQKTALVADFNGYETEADFLEAYNDETVPPFTDYEDTIQALRDQAPQRETAEETAE